MKMNMGGAETHIFELAKALSGRGHEVTVASGGGRYAEELSSLGIKTVTVPLYSKNPLLMAAGRQRLSALIKGKNSISFTLTREFPRLSAADFRRNTASAL